MKKILVTGGAGYIGSHTVVQLLANDFAVVVLDNLCNSSKASITSIQTISGKQVDFVAGDIRNAEVLQTVFERHSIDAVIHFAGLKAVGESSEKPLEYFSNNVAGSICLLQAMRTAKVKKIIFSSSATVYGDPGYACYHEQTPLAPVNVYGKTKLMVEDILRTVSTADPEWRIAILRYFNPVGAHPSGLLGEDPRGMPNNLMPLIARVASGELAQLAIFGKDYPTQDGTGRRDFIHVDDLARGHLLALAALERAIKPITVNLGTGKSYSVLEVVKAFEQASGKKIPFTFEARRSGDLAEYYADPSYAKQVLAWQAQLDLERMCEDAWRWQVQLQSMQTNT